METEIELRSGWFQHLCFQSLLVGPEGTVVHLLTVQLRRLGPRKGGIGPGQALAKAPPPGVPGKILGSNGCAFLGHR